MVKFMDLWERFSIIGSCKSSSLQSAALQNDAAFILLEKERGANLHIIDNRKQTLLHLASRNNAVDVLELLLKLGLNPNKQYC